LYQEVNERVNFEIMKRFEAEQIEFAFPSQTLYVKKD
jgi:small-conductance mechanosensitive channel